MSNQGDIAIDDVSLTPGVCPSAPQAAAPESNDCTFEVRYWVMLGPLSGLSQELRKGFAWVMPGLSQGLWSGYNSCEWTSGALDWVYKLVLRERDICYSTCQRNRVRALTVLNIRALFVPCPCRVRAVSVPCPCPCHVPCLRPCPVSCPVS